MKNNKFKGIKRKFYEKLDQPYSNCIKNKTNPLASNADLFAKTIQMAGIYSKLFCFKICVNLKVFKKNFNLNNRIHSKIDSKVFE